MRRSSIEAAHRRNCARLTELEQRTAALAARAEAAEHRAHTHLQAALISRYGLQSGH